MPDKPLKQTATTATIPTAGDGYPTGTATRPFYVSLAGAQKREVGPFYIQFAASQTAAALKLGDTAGQGYVVRRPGFVTGISAMIDAAVTGAGLNSKLRVYKNGSLLDASFDLTFTQAGAETKLYAVVAEGSIAVAAGDVLTVVYTSGAISNTPKVVAFVEVTC